MSTDSLITIHVITAPSARLSSIAAEIAGAVPGHHRPAGRGAASPDRACRCRAGGAHRVRRRRQPCFTHRSKDGVLKCPSANLHAIVLAALNTGRLSVDHLKVLIEYCPI